MARCNAIVDGRLCISWSLNTQCLFCAHAQATGLEYECTAQAREGERCTYGLWSARKTEELQV